jgi:dipeptidyl aminopeptidase/acylaminoacyl peptidase
MLWAVYVAGSLGLQKPNLTLEDLREEVYVGGARLSPDGQQIAFSVARKNMDEDKYDADVDVYDLRSHELRVLTRDREDAGSPEWSPDGKWLAFSAPDKESKPQVFAFPMDGGDALQITHSPTGVRSYSWSPDGSTVAFVAGEEPPKLEGIAKHNGSFEVGNDPYRTTSKPLALRLWVVPSSGGTARCLTDKGRSLQVVMPPGTPPNEPAWSYDGKYIYTITQDSPSYGDAWIGDRVERVAVADGTMEPVTGAKGFELYVSASPVADKVSYWKVVNVKSGMNRVFTNDVPSGAATPKSDGFNLTSKLDANMFLCAWMPDGKSLLTGSNWRDTVGVWNVGLDGTAHQVDMGGVIPANFFALDLSVGKQGQLVFGGSTADDPSEIFYMESLDSKPVQITHFNDWIKDKNLGAAFVLKWKNEGFEENGIVTLPPGFDPHKKYPLVVLPHGGPQAASLQGFNEWDQTLAADGFVIFEPNYRGSDNLGEKYMQAIWNDAGDGPGRDVFAGIKELEKKPWIDTTKESVAGWSYGGYMTSWLIGHDKRWKCAVDGAPVLDWSFMRALGDGQSGISLNFKGGLWKDGLAKDYAEQSPISYVDRIVTPTLIMADTGDQRVPTAQCFILYNALKERGVTTKFVLFPASGHYPSDPVQGEDVSRRMADWLQTYGK